MHALQTSAHFGQSLLSRLALTLLAACLCAPAIAQPPVLTVPTSVNAFETFEIRLEGSVGAGDMLRFADTDGTVLGGSYAYAGNARNGTVKLTAPIDPGNYLVVYLVEREIAVSYPLTVKPISATVTAPATVEMNASISVQFTGPGNNQDRLQIVDAAGKAVGGLYAYAGNARDGQLTLRAPTAPGEYRIVYFSGRRDIGSAPLRVTAVGASLTAPPEVAAGAHFPVGWEGPDNTGDLLRIVDTEGKPTGSYAYTGNNPDEIRLRAPEIPGSYRVLYLTGAEVIGEVAFTVSPVSAQLDAAADIPANEQLSVTWEGPGNHGDRIILIPQGQEDEVAYTYIDPDSDQPAVLLVRAAPGPHTLHYVSHGGRMLASRPLQVLLARLQPGSLQVLARQTAVLGPNDAVEMILDASGSMLQRQGSERRIDIAKRTLQQLVSDTLPEGTPFALRVFGHREANSCRTDLEIPLAPLVRAPTTATIAAVQAMNLARTPIADSLSLTASDLREVTGERIIVLLTDGEETCDGSPDDVIARLRAQGHDIRVNIVGYAIDDNELAATFARWAALGGGQYFNVREEEALAAALVSAVNSEFQVLDIDGAVVATGVPGGDPLSLMPGSYTVRAVDQDYTVTITEAQRTTLEIDP